MTEPLTPSNQDELREMMLKLARQEGHKPKLPKNNPKHHVPAPSRVKQEILNHFANNPEPISTNELLNHVDAKPPNLRRVCRDMIDDGLMRSERTNKGCIYTFVGDVSKDFL